MWQRLKLHSIKSERSMLQAVSALCSNFSITYVITFSKTGEEHDKMVSTEHQAL